MGREKGVEDFICDASFLEIAIPARPQCEKASASYMLGNVAGTGLRRRRSVSVGLR